MTKTAVVTGGAGFVGAHLSAYLERQGWRVIVVDDLSQGQRANLAALQVQAQLIVGDVAEPALWAALATEPVDAIFHLAAQASVPRSVQDPLRDFRTNVVGTVNALEYARQRPGTRLVFTSTVSVYAAEAALPLTETTPTRASSPYGAAKAAAENYCFAYAASYGVQAVVLRAFNIFGPLMNKYVIHDLTRKLLRNGRQLTILGDGEQVRDYLYVDDAVRALVLAAERGVPGEVYNLGSGQPVRIADLALEIGSALGLQDVELTFTNQSWPGDIKAWYADASKLTRLGFVPEISWAEGLRRTVEYLAVHPLPEG